MHWKDVDHARLDSEIGLGQPVGYTAHEAKLIATHEAGHATIAWLVAPQRRLEVLTIIKRRGALGLLAHGDREEVYLQSRSELLGLIQIAMGGQSAEEIFFGDVSTGPSGDLLTATRVAASMVGACGMTSSLVSFGAVQSSGFSDTNIVGRVLGDKDGRAAVEEVLQEQKLKAKTLLEENRHLVEALRDALVERHELIGSEITDVLEQAATSTGRVIPAASGRARRATLRRARRPLRSSTCVTSTPDAGHRFGRRARAQGRTCTACRGERQRARRPGDSRRGRVARGRRHRDRLHRRPAKQRCSSSSALFISGVGAVIAGVANCLFGPLAVWGLGSRDASALPGLGRFVAVAVALFGPRPGGDILLPGSGWDVIAFAIAGPVGSVLAGVFGRRAWSTPPASPKPHLLLHPRPHPTDESGHGDWSRARKRRLGARHPC